MFVPKKGLLKSPVISTQVTQIYYLKKEYLIDPRIFLIEQPDNRLLYERQTR